MDFSTILILPISAVVAFATVVAASITQRDAPRLVWPWAISTIAAALAFLRLPEFSALPLWLFALFGLAFSAALGTVFGGMAARVISRR